jgi:hypothetical protein
MRRLLAAVLALALVTATGFGAFAHAALHGHAHGAGVDHAHHADHVPPPAHGDHADCDRADHKSHGQHDHRDCSEFICHGGFAMLGADVPGFELPTRSASPLWLNATAESAAVPALDRPPIAAIRV